ncbi:MAG TPA: hypothetical protein PK037_15125 [Saprospiraceae bacterium]|nr:hypothetical protein [Saprospiraceae bacterium]
MCVFSGRPDPVWQPTESVVVHLLDLTENAPLAQLSYQLPQGLGFRGLCLFSNERMITAYNGYLYISDGSKHVVKTDFNLQFFKYFCEKIPKKYENIKSLIQ